VGSREAASLSPACREVLIGTILGDGCLERNGCNVRLRIDHSVRQRSFVEWKFAQFKELHPLEPRLVNRIDSRTGQVHTNYRFVTRNSSALNSYFEFFYDELQGKRIPNWIADLLTSPLSLAVWYMDDGGRRRDCRSGYLNTNAYRVIDVELLRACLMANFDVATRLHFAAGHPRIYIPVASFKSFCDVIEPYVISDMRYKLL